MASILQSNFCQPPPITALKVFSVISIFVVPIQTHWEILLDKIRALQGIKPSIVTYWATVRE